MGTQSGFQIKSKRGPPQKCQADNMRSCTHVPWSRRRLFYNLQLQPWRYHTSFFFTQVLLKHYSIDAAPTAHAHNTHPYRFVVFQILLVAFHAQFCQPSGNWRRLCFWSHCLQVSRKHTRQYRGKLDKLCAVYANQGQSYCILPYLCSNCIFTTCGDKFSKHNIHLSCS